MLCKKFYDTFVTEENNLISFQSRLFSTVSVKNIEGSRVGCYCIQQLFSTAKPDNTRPALCNTHSGADWIFGTCLNRRIRTRVFAPPRGGGVIDSPLPPRKRPLIRPIRVGVFHSFLDQCHFSTCSLLSNCVEKKN